MLLIRPVLSICDFCDKLDDGPSTRPKARAPEGAFVYAGAERAKFRCLLRVGSSSIGTYHEARHR